MTVSPPLLYLLPTIDRDDDSDGAQHQAHPLVQRLAAGYLECLVLQKSPTIIALWPSPQGLLDARSPLVDRLVEHLQEAATAAGALARRAVHSGMQEALEFTDLDQPTAEEYADALLQRLEWDRGPRAGEVIDFGSVVLASISRRAMRGEVFEIDPDEAV